MAEGGEGEKAIVRSVPFGSDKKTITKKKQLNHGGDYLKYS